MGLKGIGEISRLEIKLISLIIMNGRSVESKRSLRIS